ncbi:MAG TPA: cyclic nucleotide-binding domain-containing protein, partial [Gemmatimonadaceae bacterium]|nr:cyclic nucleotide-binding domain-containing protein [Gemmatimonadaceae bacterium]
MQISRIREQLRALPYLDGLTDTALHQLAQQVTQEEFAPDTVLFAEGAPRARMAFLITGSVMIEKLLGGRPTRLSTLGAGEAVGEGILLDDSPHGTSARSIEQTTAYCLTKSAIQTIVKENPALYAALVARAARAISKRLSATDATMVGRGRRLGFAGAETRTEKDLLGEREVPYDALYGVQTLRAMENFP